MKPLVRSFRIFIDQIFKDSMLEAVCIAPVLIACFFRFGIPAAEKILCDNFGRTKILVDYYLLFDLFLGLITPYLFCFASAMVMLTEYDENMVSYLAVTPVGKRGYVVSRLLFPAVISSLASVMLVSCFSLTKWSLGMLWLTGCLTSLLGLVEALLIFSFSHNQVEGIAMAKLSGLLMLGLMVPFWLRFGVQYLFAPLPSFWIAKLCVGQSMLFLAPAVLTGLTWVWFLYQRFERKIR